MLLPLLLLAPSLDYAFEPKPDSFSPSALLDLRSLNEKVAGERGFPRVDAGGDFTYGDGKPLRFWCAVTDVGREKPFTPRPLGRKDEPELARSARFLAKRGVNMVRLHAHLNPDPGAPVDSVNEKELDWIRRAIAAYKKEGIYLTVSPYWAVPAKFGADAGIGDGETNDAHGLLFFDERLQRAYRNWLKTLLSETNPYTGVAPAKDPAFALLQIQNEDSLLFWTANNLKGKARENLERKFFSFMKNRPAAWTGGGERAEDKPKEGRLAIGNLWELTQPAEGKQQARRADELAFLTETMRSFNAGIARYVKEDLGYGGLVNAGNWRTADTARLGDAERFSYTGADVDAVNRYFGGVHKGPNEGWAIMNGDRFTSPTVTRSPEEFPLALRQTAGRPILVTESAWVMPNGKACEGPFLVSAYSSLTGADGYYWFATGDDGWSQPTSANGYLPSQQKWFFSNPEMLGGFPAAALMYRTGLVKRGAPVLTETRSTSDLWSRRVPRLPEESGFDPNRDAGDVSSSGRTAGPMDPLAYFVGPVRVAFGDAPPAGPKDVDPAPYLDSAKRRARSNTGELSLDALAGLCRLDAPAAQGVCGSLAGSYATRDLKITVDNPFGSLLTVAMDGLPLATSKRVLVQVGTPARPTGWAEKPTTIELDGGKKIPGFEVVDYGRAPWRVESPRGRIEIANPGLKTAVALDANGEKLRALTVKRTPKTIAFALPPDAMYVLVR